MESAGFYTRYNAISITSIQSFADIRGGINDGRKDVYFIRCTGCGKNSLADMEAMDRKLWEREQKGWGRYCRATKLPVPADPETIARYSKAAGQWEQSGRRELKLKAANPPLERVLATALTKVWEEFKKCTPNVSSSMEKNFIIKLLYWLESAADSLIEGWSQGISGKFVLSGTIRKQEYLFCYLLTLLGIDVMMFMPAGEEVVDERLARLSILLALGPGAAVQAPPFRPEQIQMEFLKSKRVRSSSETLTGSERSTGSGATTESARQPQPAGSDRPKVNVRRPDRDARQRGMGADGRLTQTGQRQSQPSGTPSPKAPEASSNSVPATGSARVPGNRELQFEELAMLASSVVMITVHDKKGGVLGTGSGIMIGPQGYILTNNHVAAGGRFYSVRIEDEEKIYKTDEVIKYNPLLDLAVIRIDRRLKPIPLYQGKVPLARGQKVVAIGSPLGLFNSVSDGIISGFRQIHDVDMIQFTAPISHGSSGGAVLNMYGEVIGISTAGFDGGQNINLAVEYGCIANFVRGFI